MSRREALPRAHLTRSLYRTLTDIERFSRHIVGRPLRSYQLAPARAIVDSVLKGRGLTFAVLMARQAGKNETSAQIEALLLNLFRRRGGFLIKAAPTWRPQALNSRLRLETILHSAHLSPVREEGYILRVGKARIAFFSARPGANVVGATASILLEADEAQDIPEQKWRKDFRPMGASTNVTTVLWGTTWTRHTLLGCALRQLRQAEARDGIQRVFTVPWQRVAQEVPAYGRYVRREIEQLGRDHPLIRTQYFLEELDDAKGMFPEATRVLMRGTHPPRQRPARSRDYALLIDVGGEAQGELRDVALRAAQPRKDSTAITVVEIDWRADGVPMYRVCCRYLWTGRPHDELANAILSLVNHWRARHVVIDATGLGAGLAAMLRRPLGPRLTPFVFTARSKSDLGWRFLGLCNSGRFQDHRDDGSAEYATFWRQVAAADYEVLAGPNRLLRWGVADPTIHDDLLISAALCAVLEKHLIAPPLESAIIEARDPLAALDARSYKGVIS